MRENRQRKNRDRMSARTMGFQTVRFKITIKNLLNFKKNGKQYRMAIIPGAFYEKNGKKYQLIHRL